MGTRSSIAVNHNGVIKAVYCHYDGYLSWVGQILLTHYHSAKANNLVALGNVSSLGTDIGEAHDFERLDTMCEYTEEGWRTDTNFYDRDRGEENQEWRCFHCESDWIDHFESAGCEYFYLMDGGVWYVTQGKEPLLPLHEVLEDELVKGELV